MRTLRTLLRLLSDAARLLSRFWPQIGAWYCLGWSVNAATAYGSTLLGGRWQVPATILFVLGVVGWVACLVMMIHALQPGLSTVGSGGPETEVPGTVSPTPDRTDALISVLGPVMAVYAAWGLAEDQVSRLLSTNLAIHGGDWRSYSINLSQWQFWLGVAVVAWLVKRVAALVNDRRRSDAAAVVEIVADGASVLAVFVVLTRLTTLGMEWLKGRQLWRWGADVRRGVLDLLPSLPAIDLPELAGAALDALIPATANAVLLPLFWLALTATVFGWRDYEGRDLLTGTRLQAVASRVGGSPVERISLLATRDLREKYVPVLRALRLVWATGGRFIGAYLVAIALVNVISGWLTRGLQLLIGPRPTDVTLATIPLLELLTGLVGQSLLVVVYAAAFDEALRAAAGVRLHAPVWAPARPVRERSR